MDPHNPGGAQPGEPQLSPSAPQPNVGSPAPQAPVTPQAADALSLAELNSLLGRDFKSKDSALKSIKDTFSFATTRVADISKEASAAVAGELNKLTGIVESQNKEMFYLQNPQYAPHRDLIGSLGKNPAEVVQTEIFKQTFTKLAEHDKTVKSRTVLESNPRIAVANDGLSKAQALKQQHGGEVTPEVEKLAVGAVLDAYNLR